MKRQWRALFDTTLAMLDDSMLDTSSWEKHFSRKCISETECGDREANVFHIRQDLDNFLIYLTFEFVLCQVFYPIDTRKQPKLDHKSHEGILVGYASDCPTWLIYNPNIRSIARTNSVVLNEQLKPIRQGILYENRSSEVEMNFINEPNLVHCGSVSNGCTPEVNESSVASLEKTPPTFSSHIHRINHTTNYVERQDYVLNLFDKMDDAEMVPEEYYDMIKDADAQTYS